MNKKVLLCATLDLHFTSFHLPVIKRLGEMNYSVDIASKGNDLFSGIAQKFNVPFSRKPLSFNNVTAFFKLVNILNQNNYHFIHCHTPVASCLVRLAKLFSKNKSTKIIYTAHGFHFYKGAPLYNWFLYYPFEYFLSFFTDVIITINSEDYNRSLSLKSKNKYFVNGVGVDLNKFRPISKEYSQNKKIELGQNPNDFVMIYTAEFNKNKNQEFLIKSMQNLMKNYPKIKLLLAGTGPNLKKCKSLVKKFGLGSNINFLEYRNDIADIIPACDIAISTSIREGLPVNIMEAMASGLPILASNNRGHRELVEDGINGLIFKTNNADQFEQCVLKIFKNDELKQNFSNYSTKKIKSYSTEIILDQLTKIYSEMEYH